MTGPGLGVGRALVVGARVTGRAVIDALREAGVGVVVVDADAAMLAGVRDDVEALHVPDARPLLARVDVVVPSPGVAEVSPLLRAAAEAEVPVWSEPELAGRLRPDRRVLGITGTNGKTSVTELVTAMCVAGGLPATACGNIGTPLVDAVRSPGDEVLVAELSSFQLRYASRLRCEVGALLNLAPDHLDWHGGFAPYRAAKARMWSGQGSGDWAVGPAQDTTLQPLLEAAPGSVAHFDGTAPVGVGVGVEHGALHARLPGFTGPLVPLTALRDDAPHHRDNVAAAATVALLAGGSPDGVAAAATTFTAGAHRAEVVADSGGVTWVDDSKATNPHAAAAALAAPVPGGGATVWLAGGQAKGVDLGVLGPCLAGVRHAVLLGDAAEQLARVCAEAGVPSTVVAPDEADPMTAAVVAARGVARPGDRVLLSPACASFDLFTGYADRGERFAAAVRAVTGRAGADGSGVA